MTSAPHVVDMDPLDPIDVRVLGALVEKEKTTPDNYPLSLNALVNACNQTSNRDPVMQLDEATVSNAIDRLRRKSLVRSMRKSDSRVSKYSHLMAESMDLDDRARAVMCVLMLRGPETIGELKTRTERLATFESTDLVESTLDELAARLPLPLVTAIPRKPGQKETRYAHLLSGEVQFESDESAPPASSRRAAPSEERIAVLESTVAELRNEVDDMRRQLEEFRRQFE
jgi:uncharacterized protein YceH (UPF0502 family)